MRNSIKKQLKDKFDYDVSALAPYIDEQNPAIVEALVQSVSFLPKFNVMSGVKGSEKIKMLESTVTLQDASACGFTANGGMIFTDKTITVTPLKVNESYCNKTLNSHWTQMKNRVGANVEELDSPFADVMVSYKTKILMKTIQDLVLAGDTTSLNPNLAWIDGLFKQLTADADVVSVTAGANNFETSRIMARAFDPALYGTGIESVVVGSRVFGQSVIDYVWDNKDYNMNLQWESVDGYETFIIPNTTVRFYALPQITDENELYGIPLDYVSIAVDGESDTEGMELTYNETEDELRLAVEFKIGVGYIFPNKFLKLAQA